MRLRVYLENEQFAQCHDSDIIADIAASVGMETAPTARLKANSDNPEAGLGVKYRDFPMCFAWYFQSRVWTPSRASKYVFIRRMYLAAPMVGARYYSRLLAELT